MKILIVSPYRTVAPHFENELELAQLHLDEGDQVSFLSCLGELSNCEFNPDKDPATCQECRLRRRHGLSLLDGRFQQSDFAGAARRRTTDLPTELPNDCFVDVRSLNATVVGNFEVGSATMSSLISNTRDPETDVSQYVPLAKRFSKSGLQVYNAVLQQIRQQRPDRVYVFNGRFVAMRAVLRACRQAGVDCYMHERGCDTNHYQLFKNELLHMLEVYQARVRDHWTQAARTPERESSGRDWYDSRVQRVEKTWHSFVKHQQPGRLPEGWDVEKHNIVIFTSSEDECAALGDGWADRLYPNQGEAIERLARRLATRRPDAVLTVRIHPNQTGVDNPRSRRVLHLNEPNVRIIAPDATVDSYQLMRVADTVVTFGSTIGMEAVFWGKPSVLLAPSFYNQFRGPLQATDHEHAVELLAQDLMPATDHEALIYGYWCNTNGIPFKYFESNGLFSGTFKGEVVYAKEPSSFPRRIRKHLRSIKKRIYPGNRRAA